METKLEIVFTQNKKEKICEKKRQKGELWDGDMMKCGIFLVKRTNLKIL